MEISISPKKLRRGAAWLLVIVILGSAGVQLWKHQDAAAALVENMTGPLPFFSGTPTPEVQPAAAAAEKGVTAFFTMDYQEPIDTWLKRVCAVSTDDGCQMAQTLSPSIEDLIVYYQAKTGCTAQALERVDEDDIHEVWRVHVTLDHPFSDMPDSQDVYVVVVRSGDTWTFERLLFDDEVEKYLGD